MAILKNKEICTKILTLQAAKPIEKQNSGIPETEWNK
jgi:hypothetical protein